MSLVEDSLPSPLHHVHVMGIGGTAMAALAGMLHDAAYHVTGSDGPIYPPMSTYLAGLGIPVAEGYSAKNLDPRPDLVVVGNVIRAENDEAKALLGSDIPYCSFPQALGHLFLKDAHSIVVAGTHGKTTTTAVTAWLLDVAGKAPGFLIGGVAANFDRTARRGDGQLFVIEGDEYDTAFFDKGPKFLHYRARTCVLTSVEFDHADIYRDLEHVKSAFRRLLTQMPTDGLLVVRGDDAGAAEVSAEAKCAVHTYGPGQEWDGRIESVDPATGTMRFALLRKGVDLAHFDTGLVGTHNLYNQVAAAAAALSVGTTIEQLAQGFSTFRGVKRRQEIIGEPGQVTVVDDFAHHPTAVRVTLQALRQRFGGRRLWAIWEPRSATSRRAVFQQEYAESFDDADLVVIAAPFDQTRIEEQDRFSADRLVDDLVRRGKDAMVIPEVDAIAGLVGARSHPYDVVAILSNGGFGGLHGKVLQRLGERFP